VHLTPAQLSMLLEGIGTGGDPERTCSRCTSCVCAEARCARDAARHARVVAYTRVDGARPLPTLQADRRLEQRLERKNVHIEALKAEVIRLRRWRSGARGDARSEPRAAACRSRAIEAPAVAVVDTAVDAFHDPRLGVGGCARRNTARARPVRALAAELPRVMRVHAPAAAAARSAATHCRQLGEDTSEQLDYVRGFQVIRHVRPKLVCRTCARILQAAVPSPNRSSADYRQGVAGASDGAR